MSATTFDSAVVAGLLGSALDYCAEKAGLPGREAALAAVQSGECATCECVRHGLAMAVAEYLGSVDSTIRAIYVYDPERAAAVDEPVVTLGINLIVWTSRKSAALASLVDLVRKALAEEHARLACPKANALCCALDVQIADDDQVQNRAGYGALIHSLYVRPQEIWRRQLLGTDA